jgi:sugar-phosphatase
MHQVGLIVFDMDGVLIDSSDCHARAFADLWSSIGLGRPPTYSTIAGRPTEAVIREYAGHLDPSGGLLGEWARFKQGRAREYLRSAVAFPDTLPVLRTLAEAGHQLALATGASSATTRMLLEQTRLGALFPVVVTAADVHNGKPSPETYTMAISRSARSPEHTLVVEDSAAGLAAGLAAGAFAASVRTGERCSHARFVDNFPDLTALLAWIEAVPA